MHPLAEALRTALGMFREHGIWVVVGIFLLVFAYSYGKKHQGQNPKQVPQRDLTPEERKKEGNQQFLGCIIGVILIAGLTWLLT